MSSAQALLTCCFVITGDKDNLRICCLNSCSFPCNLTSFCRNNGCFEWQFNQNNLSTPCMVTTSDSQAILSYCLSRNPSPISIKLIHCNVTSQAGLPISLHVSSCHSVVLSLAYSEQICKNLFYFLRWNPKFQNNTS